MFAFISNEDSYLSFSDKKTRKNTGESIESKPNQESETDIHKKVE